MVNRFQTLNDFQKKWLQDFKIVISILSVRQIVFQNSKV